MELGPVGDPCVDTKSCEVCGANQKKRDYCIAPIAQSAHKIMLNFCSTDLIFQLQWRQVDRQFFVVCQCPLLLLRFW